MPISQYGRKRSLSYILLSALVAAVYLMGSATAHEINPVIIDAQLQSDNRIRFELTLNLEAQVTGIAENHDNTEGTDNEAEYNRLRALSSEQLALEASAWRKQANTLIGVSGPAESGLSVVSLDIPETGNLAQARESTLVLTTNEPVTENWFLTWRPSLGSIAFRFSTPEAQDVVTAYLQDGTPSNQVDMNNLVSISALSAFLTYIPVGFEHIVPLGLDHILFVIGLFLLSTHWKPLLWQVSAFTLAHTLTLALGMLGIIRISADVIEPLIALSIVYVAIENILFKRMRWWRPLLIFSFGLLHGLGFASVLTEFGLTTQSFVAGLIGFNLGVEFGQLTVIAVCYLLVGIWFSGHALYRKVVIIPGSLMIAVIGGYWFIERTFG